MFSLLIEPSGQNMLAKSFVEWCEKGDFETRARQLIRPASVVLDIGCGIRPQRFVVPDVAICVEPYQEYIDYLKRNVESANILIIPLGALAALKALPDRSVDSVFMIDVIEHMPKNVGVQVVDECLRVARGQIIIFTPLGFMPQSVHAGEVDGWGLSGGEYQDHKSGWSPEDFPEWDIVACKNLHSVDHRGLEIDPPYGGFYAIKDLPKRSDLINHTYAEEVIKKSLCGVSAGELLDEFARTFVDREFSRINTRCAIKTCLIAAEQLSLGVAPEDESEVFEKIQSQKYALFKEEGAEFSKKILAFGKTLSSFCERENTITAREADLASREDLFVAMIADKEEEIKSRERMLEKKELDFNASKSVKLLRALKLFSK